MAEDKQLSIDADATSRENARIGYQAAIDLATAEGEHNWARFNVMLVANSVFIGVIGLVITTQFRSPILVGMLSLLGVGLCIVWLLMMKRGFDYETYYVLSAREMEERYLADPVKTVSRGGAFADGKPIQLRLDGSPQTLKMSKWSRLRARRASSFIIVVFTVVYTVFFVGTLLQWW